MWRSRTTPSSALQRRASVLPNRNPRHARWGAKVTQDVPPWAMAHGDRARLVGLNVERMKREGLDELSKRSLKRAYRYACRQGMTTDQVIAALAEGDADSPHAAPSSPSSQRATEGSARLARAADENRRSGDRRWRRRSPRLTRRRDQGRAATLRRRQSSRRIDRPDASASTLRPPWRSVRLVKLAFFEGRGG